MKMKIDILTIFPQMFKGPFEESIIKRAQEKSLVKITVHDLRQWAKDKHKSVDDRPYGGGAGMVMRVDVIVRAITQLKTKKSKVILLTPQGKPFNQEKAQELSKIDHLILIAGHYEGVDERADSVGNDSRDAADEEHFHSGEERISLYHERTSRSHEKERRGCRR